MDGGVTFPGIMPERVENPTGAGDPILNGLRLTCLRDEIRAILVSHGVTWGDITGRHHRYPAYVASRKEVAELLDGRGWSAPRIGKLMKRHHTTVLYWLGRINKAGLSTRANHR